LEPGLDLATPLNQLRRSQPAQGLDTFWKPVAIKHGDMVEEFAQHAPRRQTGKAPPDDHSVRSPHNGLRVLGHKIASEQASAAKLNLIVALRSDLEKPLIGSTATTLQ
jgi:hypothetical protein